MIRLKVGVIGCGFIAQYMHLPYLAELEDRYEIYALCDLSHDVLRRVGERYHVARRYTDYRDALATDIDAVMIMLPVPTPPGEVAVQAALAGKHLFIEKPMAYSEEEAEATVQAAAAARVRLMVAYMKRYDPGFLYGQGLMQEMPDVSLIRSHDPLVPVHLAAKEVYRVFRGSDVSDAAKQHNRDLAALRFREAIGDVSEELATTYRLLLEHSIHDFSILRGVFGDPQDVVAFDVWNGGRSYLAVLDYGSKGRCIHDVTPVGIKRFDEELVAYGRNGIVRIAFPNPYLRNAPTVVSVRNMDGSADSEREVVSSYEEAFRRELVHFHECVTEGTDPATPGIEAKKDVALAAQLIRAFLARKER